MKLLVGLVYALGFVYGTSAAVYQRDPTKGGNLRGKRVSQPISDRMLAAKSNQDYENEMFDPKVINLNELNNMVPTVSPTTASNPTTNAPTKTPTSATSANDDGSETAVTWKKYDATDCQGAHTEIDGSKFYGGSQQEWQTKYTVDEMLAECKSKCTNNEACVAFNFRDNREHPDYPFGGSVCHFWSTITDTPDAVGDSKDCWVSSTWKKYDATDCQGAHTEIDGSKFYGGSQQEWQTKYTVDEMLAECKSKCTNNEACVAFNFRDNREHPDYPFGGSVCHFWSTITDTPDAVGDSKDCWVSSKANYA